MENSILNIAWEAGGSIPINAKNSYRCDQGSTSSKIEILYDALAFNANPWRLELDFDKDITENDKLTLETALINAQQEPRSLIDFKMPSGAVLKSSTPITNIQN